MTESPAPTRRHAPGMSEDDLLRSVRKLATLLGYLVYHTRWSKGSEPGFPDLCLVHAQWRRLVFAELKTDTGKTTAAQDRWLASLRATGTEAYLWRPADLGALAAILQAPAPPTPVEGN